MPEKDPFSYQWITYVWVIGLAMLAGVVSYINKVKGHLVQHFSIMELLGEITTAGFIGLLTFWLCEATNTPMIVTAPVIGIASHMGSRLLFALEKVFESKIKSTLDKFGIK